MLRPLRGANARFTFRCATVPLRFQVWRLRTGAIKVLTIGYKDFVVRVLAGKWWQGFALDPPSPPRILQRNFDRPALGTAEFKEFLLHTLGLAGEWQSTQNRERDRERARAKRERETRERRRVFIDNSRHGGTRAKIADEGHSRMRSTQRYTALISPMTAPWRPSCLTWSQAPHAAPDAVLRSPWRRPSPAMQAAGA